MKKTVLAAAMLLMGSAVLFTESCKKSDNASTPPTTKTLYDTLGGTTMVKDPTSTSGGMIEKGRLALRSVVDSSIFVIAGDPAINGHFTVLLAEVTNGNTSGFAALSKNLTDFFCIATGSTTNTYGGKSMKAAHDPAQNSRMNGKASNSDFDAFITDVVAGAKKNGVTDPVIIGRLGTIINSVRGAVVQQ